jgi:hypothetical protein
MELHILDKAKVGTRLEIHGEKIGILWQSTELSSSSVLRHLRLKADIHAKVCKRRQKFD